MLYLNAKISIRAKKFLNTLHRGTFFLKRADISDPDVAGTGVLMHLKLCTRQKISHATSLQFVLPAAPLVPVEVRGSQHTSGAGQCNTEVNKLALKTGLLC